MKLKHLGPALGAAMILSGGMAAAQSTATGAIGGGAATATNAGATAAGGALGGTVSRSGQAQHHDRMDRDKRKSVRSADRNAGDTSVRAPAANTSTTYGAGSVYTDRNSTAAGVTAGGLATGTGSQSTSSTVDAYGETTRNGTSADIYGNATANSGATSGATR